MRMAHTALRGPLEGVVPGSAENSRGDRHTDIPMKNRAGAGLLRLRERVKVKVHNTPRRAH